MKWIPRVALLLLTLCLLTGCVRYGEPMYDTPYWNEPVQTTVPTADTPQLWDSALWDLQADRLCFGLNQDYETRFTVRGQNVQSVSLYYEGSAVANMVDDGTAGDARAWDGIYTCTVTNRGDEAGQDHTALISFPGMELDPLKHPAIDSLNLRLLAGFSRELKSSLNGDGVWEVQIAL